MVDLVAQIQARKVVKQKIPDWYNCHPLVYPTALPLEQCSSQATAVYKCQQLSGSHMVDLTGGLGGDSYFLSRHFDRITFIEKSPELCSLARHNFKALGASNIKIVQADSAKILTQMKDPIDLIFADPSRRSQGRKVYRLQQSRHRSRSQGLLQ